MKINSNLNRILSLLEKSRKEDLELKPIANNKFIYALSVDGKCLCFNAELNQSSTNRVTETNHVNKQVKLEEENKIVEKKITSFDFIVVNNGTYEYTVILLNEDISQTLTSYMLVKKQTNESLSGVLINPIFYDKNEKELIILENKIKISKKDIFSEQQICSGRKLIILKDGKKLIANSMI